MNFPVGCWIHASMIGSVMPYPRARPPRKQALIPIGSFFAVRNCDIREAVMGDSNRGKIAH
jgi:hypothetical protein